MFQGSIERLNPEENKHVPNGSRYPTVDIIHIYRSQFEVSSRVDRAITGNSPNSTRFPGAPVAPLFHSFLNFLFGSNVRIALFPPVPTSQTRS